MSTEKQNKQLVARFVEHQEFFSDLSSEDIQWAIQNPKDAVALCVQAIQYFLQRKVGDFAQLLDACKQVYIISEFTEWRFHLEKVTLDEDGYEVVEHHFTNTVTIEEGLRRLAKMAKKGEIRLLTGSRLAMNYIATHLDVQLDHPVILPLYAQSSEGYNFVPVFDCLLDDRSRCCYLGMYHFNKRAHPNCGWLVLRKRTSVAG